MTFINTDLMLLSDTEGKLHSLTVTGSVTFLSTLDHVAKGLTPLSICTADTNDDETVNVTDLLLLLANWGSCSQPCSPDLNLDAAVNVTDLLTLLANWGTCIDPDP